VREVGRLASAEDIPASLRHGFAGFERVASSATVATLLPAFALQRDALGELVSVGLLEGSLIDALLDQAGDAFAETITDAIAEVVHEHLLTGVAPAWLALGLRLVVRLARREREQAALGQFARARTQLELAALNIFKCGWDHVVDFDAYANLARPKADRMVRVEQRVATAAAQIDALIAKPDECFTAQVSETASLARMLPNDPHVQMLHRYAEMLALVRPYFLGSWLARSALEFDEALLGNASGEFLRLLGDDRVLAFCVLKLRGWGRHGLALTTSSVQWRKGDIRGGFGLSEIPPDSIHVHEDELLIGAVRLTLGATEAVNFAGALQACVRFVAARPGPKLCSCGAPGHWFRFGPNGAVCRGCGR